jgi:catechol 2,3-dioxygenase-like lactoylglutathione lyase family enzyme
VTDRKDFKRVVRARARKTGESYSSALRNVRAARPDRTAATASAGNDHSEPLVTITRTIPDVRSTHVDKTVHFYTELLGFDARTDGGRVVAFVSASHQGVEVSVNRDGFALPPGFTVEVETADHVAELFDRTLAADVRVIEALRDAQFSVLDPSGRRVTVAAAPAAVGPASRATDRPIARVIPETVVEASAAKGFYADHLGFRVRDEWPGIVMFTSGASAAQVVAVADLTSPSAFDIDVGTAERVDAIHAAAVGAAVVMGPPQDFPAQGVRCFLLLDPNGTAINVTAPLAPSRSGS